MDKNKALENIAIVGVLSSIVYIGYFIITAQTTALHDCINQYGSACKLLS